MWTIQLSVGKSAWRAKRVIAEVRSGTVGGPRLLPRRNGHRRTWWQLEPVGPLSVPGRRIIWMRRAEGRRIRDEDIIAQCRRKVDVGEIAGWDDGVAGGIARLSGLLGIVRGIRCRRGGGRIGDWAARLVESKSFQRCPLSGEHQRGRRRRRRRMAGDKPCYARSQHLQTFYSSDMFDSKRTPLYVEPVASRRIPEGVVGGDG